MDYVVNQCVAYPGGRVVAGLLHFQLIAKGNAYVTSGGNFVPGFLLATNMHTEIKNFNKIICYC